jgi:hypothetical protein
MKNKISHITKMGMLLALTAIAVLGMVPRVRAGGGSFYLTVTNETQLVADINYANTNGGTFTINLQPNTTFDLITVGGFDPYNGEVMLPIIGTPKAVNLTILGNGDTLQMGGYEARLLEVAGASSLTLDHMTLTNGYSYAHNGGAIYNLGTLLISNCTFSGNISFFDGYESDLRGGEGGAIYNSGGTVIISDSFLSGNYVFGNDPECEGGAIGNDYGTVTISNSTISGNYAEGVGGGIFNNSGTVTISHCTISSNNADGGGGGICNDYGTVTISHSTISGNKAGDGGGINNNNGTVTVDNSTLSGNSAYYYVDDDGYGYGGYGGGIYNNGKVTVENSSSITGNSATDFGPDIYNLGQLYLDGTSTIGVLDGSSAIGLNPALSIQSWSSTAHHLVLSWSTNYTGCTLQSSTDLGSTNWTDCASPAVSGASFVVTNSMSAGAQFFRLKR